jgi:hypothetical protein
MAASRVDSSGRIIFHQPRHKATPLLCIVGEPATASARACEYVCARVAREKEIFVTPSAYVSGCVFVILCVPSDEYRARGARPVP